MTIELKLDANALEALFPLGSDIRYKLQQAVLEESSRRFIKNHLDADIARVFNDLRIKLAAEFKDYVDKLMYVEAPKMARSLAPELSYTVVSTIKDEANRQISKLISDQVQESICNLEERVNHKIEADRSRVLQEVRTKVQSTIQLEINNIVSSYLKDVLKEKIQKSLESTLKDVIK